MSANSESSSVTLRMIDFFTIPKVNGDCVVLLLVHPGLNLLGRYFPPLKVNDLLLADVSRTRPSSSHGDIYMMGVEEPDMNEDMEPLEIMDLATFLEYVPPAATVANLTAGSQIRHSSDPLLGDAPSGRPYPQRRYWFKYTGPL